MVRFRELRLQRGLSQEQLCRQYNAKYNRKYTAAAMSLIEHEKRFPELGALLDFADFYNVSLDYLLGRDMAGKASYEFPVDNTARSWRLSEQLRNIILGLYNVKASGNAVAGSTLSMKNAGIAADDKKAQRETGSFVGEKLVMDELGRLDSMGEEEGNIEMLRSLLKQSFILARRVEKRCKAWYKY